MRETIRRIRDAVHRGRLPAEFTPKQVNSTLGIDWAGVFLPKHRAGDPGGKPELFVQPWALPAEGELGSRIVRKMNERANECSN
jgi:hypothetical protein